MTQQLIRTEFHTAVATQIAKDIQLSRANYYYFLGRVTTWGGTDVSPESEVIESFDEDDTIRNNIIYLRKISPNDVSLVMRRHDWVSGEIYSRWDSSIEMKDLPFYVINSANKVYKCLDNNNGAASTIEPTTVTYNQIETADGYIWKYMFSIPAFKNFKFSNSSYVPVQTAVSDSFYNSGSIGEITIVNGGEDYTTATISVAGDGTGAAFTAILSGGQIVDINTVSAGSGYSYAEITITGDGTGAILTASIGLNDIVSDQSIVEQTTTPGAIYAINVTEAGSGYGTATVPTITINGDGTGATATAYMSGGSIDYILMDNYGSGYSYANITIDAPVDIGGVQATAAIIKGPYNGHGYDAVEELFGSTLAISSVLNANTLLTEINQDYRQYGIVRNPTKIGKTTFANVDNELACWKVSFASTVGLSNDLILKFQEHQFVVAAYDSNTVYLQQLSSDNITPLGAITTLDGLTTFSITEVLSSPTINKYSGALMLVSNENPFIFTYEQNIALKTYIKI